MPKGRKKAIVNARNAKKAKNARNAKKAKKAGSVGKCFVNVEKARIKNLLLRKREIFQRKTHVTRYKHLHQ